MIVNNNVTYQIFLFFARLWSLILSNLFLIFDMAIAELMLSLLSKPRTESCIPSPNFPSLISLLTYIKTNDHKHWISISIVYDGITSLNPDSDFIVKWYYNHPSHFYSTEDSTEQYNRKLPQHPPQLHGKKAIEYQRINNYCLFFWRACTMIAQLHKVLAWIVYTRTTDT